MNKKIKTLIILMILTILVIVIGIFILRKDKIITIPDNAEYVGRIIQSKSQSDYGDIFYKYSFYNVDGKYIYQKIEEIDPGITCLYIEPKILSTKYINNKKDIEKIIKEIENNKKEYEIMNIYCASNNEINSLDEFMNFLQIK